jgi:hypothetical protein
MDRGPGERRSEGYGIHTYTERRVQYIDTKEFLPAYVW